MLLNKYREKNVIIMTYKLICKVLHDINNARQYTFHD